MDVTDTLQIMLIVAWTVLMLWAVPVVLLLAAAKKIEKRLTDGRTGRKKEAGGGS